PQEGSESPGSIVGESQRRAGSGPVERGKIAHARVGRRNNGDLYCRPSARHRCSMAISWALTRCLSTFISMKHPLLLGLLIALVVWLRTALYTVDYTEFAYVARFGEKVAVYNGETDAGLKLKAPWPIESVIRIDRRSQSFDLPGVESLTRDPINRTVDKTLAVDAFVTWKIPDAAAAEQFVKVFRTPEQARRILAPLINGRLAAIISTLPLDNLIGVADVEEGLAGIAGAAAATVGDGRFRTADLAAIDDRSERVRLLLLGEQPGGDD